MSVSWHSPLKPRSHITPAIRSVGAQVTGGIRSVDAQVTWSRIDRKSQARRVEFYMQRTGIAEN